MVSFKSKVLNVTLNILHRALSGQNLSLASDMSLANMFLYFQLRNEDNLEEEEED